MPTSTVRPASPSQRLLLRPYPPPPTPLPATPFFPPPPAVHPGGRSSPGDSRVQEVGWRGCRPRRPPVGLRAEDKCMPGRRTGAGGRLPPIATEPTLKKVDNVLYLCSVESSFSLPTFYTSILFVHLSYFHSLCTPVILPFSLLPYLHTILIAHLSEYHSISSSVILSSFMTILSAHLSSYHSFCSPVILPLSLLPCHPTILSTHLLSNHSVCSPVILPVYLLIYLPIILIAHL